MMIDEMNFNNTAEWKSEDEIQFALCDHKLMCSVMYINGF